MRNILRWRKRVKKVKGCPRGGANDLLLQVQLDGCSCDLRQGLIDHQAVRYVLHRMFVQKYGRWTALEDKLDGLDRQTVGVFGILGLAQKVKPQRGPQFFSFFLLPNGGFLGTRYF